MHGETSVGSNEDAVVNETKTDDVDTATETNGGAGINNVVDNHVSFDNDNAECHNNCVISWTCDDDKIIPRPLRQVYT